MKYALYTDSVVFYENQIIKGLIFVIYGQLGPNVQNRQKSVIGTSQKLWIQISSIPIFFLI